MKAVYDRDTDTLTLVLCEVPIAESDELKEGVIVDYDDKGHVVSVELLDASRHATDPARIAYEVKPAIAG
ncbi:MAG: DUF2283 domain-containing protein [Nitrospirae bacterium]|nr:DUF2283 domain-containing protein [Nitrospirota bacterium]